MQWRINAKSIEELDILESRARHTVIGDSVEVNYPSEPERITI